MRTVREVDWTPILPTGRPVLLPQRPQRKHKEHVVFFVDLCDLCDLALFEFQRQRNDVRIQSIIAVVMRKPKV
jgi:hypothetical protein